MSGLSRFDSDAEALEWARAKVENVEAKFREWERQARSSDQPDRAMQWRKFANFLRMEFIGGEGCVIARFDARLPQMTEAMNHEKGGQ